MAKEPVWVDEFAAMLHTAFTHMVPADWGPVDFFGLWALMDATFIKKLHVGVREAKEKDISDADVIKAFPSPSSLRAAIYFLIVEYSLSSHTAKAEAREVIDYFVNILQKIVPEDTWGGSTNRAHAQGEIDALLKKTKWQAGGPQAAREIGKLINSGSALSYALYRDFFPQESNENYGPYDTTAFAGPNMILVIKHFLKLRPVELWAQTKDDVYEDIKIYRIFKGVKYSSEFTGMHSLYEGDVIAGLYRYAVEINGKSISDLVEMRKASEEMAIKATEYMKIYETMSQEEIKQKTLEWFCYQFVHFFRLVGMDWRPTDEMKEIVAGRPIKSRTVVDSLPGYDEYATSKEWEIYWLRELYQ